MFCSSLVLRWSAVVVFARTIAEVSVLSGGHEVMAPVSYSMQTKGKNTVLWHNTGRGTDRGTLFAHYLETGDKKLSTTVRLQHTRLFNRNFVL